MDYGYGGGGEGGGGYTTTSYGAQGGAGDGGFLNTGSQENTLGSRGHGEDSLRPVTIKQVAEAEQQPGSDQYTIDGMEVKQITFVGQIRSIATSVTNHTYKLEDGTGSIDVKRWIDPESSEREDDSSKPKLGETAYVRVFGQIKDLASKRYVQAKPGSVRLITDFNEIQYHLLEATVVHLHFTRGPPGGHKNAQTGVEANGMAGIRQQDGYDVQMGGMRGKTMPPGLSASAKKVYQCLHSSPQTNEGLHVQDIAVRLTMNPADVQQAGEELLNAGTIYTTVDDLTWAVLDDV